MRLFNAQAHRYCQLSLTFGVFFLPPPRYTYGTLRYTARTRIKFYSPISPIASIDPHKYNPARNELLFYRTGLQHARRIEQNRIGRPLVTDGYTLPL